MSQSWELKGLEIINLVYKFFYNLDNLVYCVLMRIYQSIT